MQVRDIAPVAYLGKLLVWGEARDKAVLGTAEFWERLFE